MSADSKPLVIEGVSHAYQLHPENTRGRYGEIFSEVMWSFHPPTNGPHALTREQWIRDWQADEFMETVFLESHTDMVCTHSIPVYDAYHAGAQSIERGAELKRRWPNRVLWYAGVPVWDGPEALEKVREYVAMGADGLKFYPAWHYGDGTRWYTMDDPTMVYPVLDLAMELGIRNIAVHKALPVGPVESDAMRVNDLGRCALRYPELNFQIVHAGFMFMEETRALLMSFPNVYCTLEGSFLFLLLDPGAFSRMLCDMLLFGGPERIIYSANVPVGHCQTVMDAFAAFDVPDDFQVPLDAAARELILGGNLQRLHGIDAAARRKLLSGDEFSRAVEEGGLRAPFSSVRKRFEGVAA